jgi:transposase
MFEPSPLGHLGGIGVIDMELLSVIRRWRYRDHFSIREISRRTGLSRNTVRKYLRWDTVEPKFNIPDRPSKLDPYADKLSQMLRQEAGKSRKQKRTTKQLHADLTALGYDGSYNRVAAFARDWKAARQQEQKTCGRGVFVPLAFLPGEAFQFDWSEDWAVIGGERTKLQVAHFKLSYSRAFILRAYPQQTHEMLFDAHNHAFRVLGGVPRRGIYDNMRTAVDKIGRGKERQVNARFSAMVSHFLFEAEFCNPASGWEKGQIEKNVQDARHRLWQPMPNFSSLAALNDCLEARCRELWAQTLHVSQPGAIADVWAEEVGCLMQLSRPFDGFVEYAKRVSPTCLVHLDRNRYSVPASFANRPVSVRVYPERIVVVAEGQIVCEHRRVFARSHERKSTTTVYDWRHYLAVVQRKPGALRNGAPFAELPPAFRALQQRMLKTPGGDREMVEILALVLQHDEQAVLAAVELALEAGAPTKTHILNLLHRLVDGKPTDAPTIKAPQALTLTTEPQSNVERYDALRRLREARHAS